MSISREILRSAQNDIFESHFYVKWVLLRNCPVDKYPGYVIE